MRAYLREAFLAGGSINDRSQPLSLRDLFDLKSITAIFVEMMNAFWIEC